LIDFERVLHRRGVFGTFLNAARIAVGDDLVVTEQRFEEIPYAMNDRIRWYLNKRDRNAAALDLVQVLGLPPYTGRFLPRLLEKLSPPNARVAVVGE
jgi:hypothetical protein